MVAGQKYPGSNILFIIAFEMINIRHFVTKKALSGEYRKMLVDVDRNVNASYAKLIRFHKGRKSYTLEKTSIDGPCHIEFSYQPNVALFEQLYYY